ncbi:MAG: NAD-dependent epimerase/dehydratase family protein, partial [Candidatus Methylomirabilales bacterium]
MPDAILITGGGGFLGAAVAEQLLARQPGAKLILNYRSRTPRLARFEGRACLVPADLTDAAACRALVAPDVGVVFHLASLVSGGAEADFLAGMQANLHASLHLLEACRLAGTRPRFVFPSSIASFGGAHLPETVTDWTHQHPQNSYGVAKAVVEQLLNDYSRKGYVDGRGLRLPAIVVRDEANTAASGYASALIREPLAGRDYPCPVSAETRIPILSLRRCVALLIACAELDAAGFGDYRTLNSPGLSPSAAEIADAVRSSGAPGAGRITFRPDPDVERIVAAWPRYMEAERAKSLGLAGDASIQDIVREYRAS